MLKNYLLVALRNFNRNKFHGIINLFGLSIGLGATILLLFFIGHELSYDSFHKKKDRIYRFVTQANISGKSIKASGTYGLVPPHLAEDVPSFENYVRLASVGEVTVLLDNSIKGSFKRAFCDSTFFSIFSFPLLSGNRTTCLQAPNSAVITKSSATKIFGQSQALNQTITVNEQDYTVTAVMDDFAANSSIQYDILLSMTTHSDLETYMKHRGISIPCYFLISENAEWKPLEKQLIELTQEYLKPRFFDKGIKVNTEFQPLPDIHLHSSDITWDSNRRGQLSHIFIFSFLAFFIITIAVINFINLITARSETRAVEVGMRKVLGANKRDLIYQFLGESMLISFVAFFIALIIVEVSIKSFGQLVNRQLDINYAEHWYYLLSFIVLTLVISIVSGAYPAFYLSKFKPVTVLKNRRGKMKRRPLQIVLVILQFAISAFLISDIIILYEQVQFMKNKNPGFNVEKLIYLSNLTDKIEKSYRDIKQDLEKHQEISSVTASSNIPTKMGTIQNSYQVGDDPETAILINENRVQDDYIKTYQMKIVKGRDFDTRLASDSNALIINQRAVESFGMSEPIGKEIIVWDIKGKIIGVVSDFHFESVHSAINPLVITHYAKWFNYIAIRLNGRNYQDIIKHIKTVFARYDEMYDFNYKFFDETYEAFYRKEEKNNRLITIAAALAIILSMLGLYALTSFTVIRRTKEIGIRKTLGAESYIVLLMLIKEFIKWILVSCIIALPASYFIMSYWLSKFAYRIEIRWWYFAITVVVMLVIAILAVSYQAIRAARKNPVTALRYE